MFTYTIPKYFDPQDHKASMRVKGINTDYMTLDGHLLTFTNLPIGEYRLAFILTDEIGASAEYKFVVLM